MSDTVRLTLKFKDETDAKVCLSHVNDASNKAKQNKKKVTLIIPFKSIYKLYGTINAL